MIDTLEARQGLLSLDLIQPRPDQPRSAFDMDSLVELIESIRAHGILEPLVVRPQGRHYEIVCGERRYRAARELGLAHVPVRAVDIDSDRAFIVAIHENVHRDSLTPIDEARAYQRLLDSGRAASQRKLAQMINVSQARVSQRLALLRLPDEVIGALSIPDGGLTERHARILRMLVNGEDQRDLARRILTEKLTVEQTEAIVETSERRPRRARAHGGWIHERGYRWRSGAQGLELLLRSEDPATQARMLRQLADDLESSS